jgi:hypothetical protein
VWPLRDSHETAGAEMSLGPRPPGRSKILAIFQGISELILCWAAERQVARDLNVGGEGGWPTPLEFAGRTPLSVSCQAEALEKSMIGIG